MKQLILGRHAKSTWKDKAIDDIDRPLKESGITEAYNVAKILFKNDCFPDRIITSTANRAIHTALIYSRLLEYASKKIEISSDLYLPSEKKLFKFISNLNNENSSVMLVGHNPSFSSISNKVLEGHDIELSTSGVIVINFKINNWSEINTIKGELEFQI